MLACTRDIHLASMRVFKIKLRYKLMNFKNQMLTYKMLTWWLIDCAEYRRWTSCCHFIGYRDSAMSWIRSELLNANHFKWNKIYESFDSVKLCSHHKLNSKLKWWLNTMNKAFKLFKNSMWIRDWYGIACLNLIKVSVQSYFRFRWPMS